MSLVVKIQITSVCFHYYCLISLIFSLLKGLLLRFDKVRWLSCLFTFCVRYLQVDWGGSNHLIIICNCFKKCHIKSFINLNKKFIVILFWNYQQKYGKINLAESNPKMHPKINPKLIKKHREPLLKPAGTTI